MIVQCEQCQTRFKIPDEKVTEKGVKVRCTKCQNTFRVAREPAPA
ncbi:zinc-ribbon domain-containing protein, partial [Corallococcus exiguus]